MTASPARLRLMLIERGVDVARRLVLAAMPTAFCRLRHEHAAWAERVIAIDPADARLAGIAARWAWAQLDHRRLVEFATMGIDAVSDGDPRSATCRTFLALMLLFTGRAEEATAWLPALRRDLGADNPTYDRVLTAIPLVLAAQGDPTAFAQFMDVLRALIDEIDRIGAPSLLVAASLAEAIALLSDQPVDVRAVQQKLATATEHARRSGDALWEIQALNVSANAALAFGSPDAARHCREMLTRAYDSRFWVIVGQAAPLALVALESAGRHDAATTIVGALERHFSVTHPMAREICSRYVTAASEHDDSARLIARGAAMDRDEMTRFIIDELAAT